MSDYVKIRVATYGGDVWRPATVFGDWAVHPPHGDASDFCDWMLTHAPTGRGCGGPFMAGLDEADACRIAQLAAGVDFDPMNEPDLYWIMLQLKAEALDGAA